MELFAADIGNSRVSLGRLDGRTVKESSRIDRGAIAPVVEAIAAWRETAPEAPMLIASVDDEAAANLAHALRDQLQLDAYRVGNDLPVPIGTALDPESIVGVDRLLAAAAVFAEREEACIIADAGTAMTIDFVDGTGVFHGGVIAPGARMQLQALAGGTALLPEVDLAEPEDGPFGRNTADAMRLGVIGSLRGLLRFQVDRYAEHYGAYPRVVVTGGDAEVLFGNDELVDKIDADLALRGVAIAAERALGEPTGDDA